VKPILKIEVIIVLIIFIAYCLNAWAGKPKNDYTRLIKLIRLEDRETPLVAFSDFEAEFNTEGHGTFLGYFNDHPTDSISAAAMLTSCGFLQTAAVNVGANGNQSTLEITAYHSSGDKTFTIDNEGAVHW